MRRTKDVDIVADPDQANLARVAGAAADVGGHVQRADAFVSSSSSIESLLVEGQHALIDTELGLRDAP